MNNSFFRLNQLAASLFTLCLCTFISGCSCQSSSESEETEKFPADGYVNGHGYVDLGLSVKWAICNIGADSPIDYGAYCTIDYHPSILKNVHLLYDSANDIEAINNMVKDAEGGKIAITVGDCTYEYDGGDLLNVALFADCEDVQKYWGNQWRLPTGSEMEELFRCRWEYTKRGGHRGYEVIGPNGNSIFLPTTGYFDGWLSPYDTKSYGYYLSGFKYNEPKFPKNKTVIPTCPKGIIHQGGFPGHSSREELSDVTFIGGGIPDAMLGRITLDEFDPKFKEELRACKPKYDTTFLYTFQFDKKGRCFSAWYRPEILLAIRPVSE